MEFFANIIVGMLSGIYAGLIVARYQRFADLRLEARKIVLRIDFMDEESRIVLRNERGIEGFPIIASDLFFLRHRQAGEAVNGLWSKMSKVLYDAQHGKMDFATFCTEYAAWQKEVRSLRPNLWQLLRFKGGL